MAIGNLGLGLVQIPLVPNRSQMDWGGKNDIFYRHNKKKTLSGNRIKTDEHKVLISNEQKLKKIYHPVP